MVVVVARTHIGAAPMTSTAPWLVRVSLNTVVVTDMGLRLLPWARLMGTELLSCDEAGYRVQLMGRLRSDCEELFEALEDMGDLEVGDGSLSWKSLLFK